MLFVEGIGRRLSGSSDGTESASREKEQKRQIDRLLCWIAMSASCMVLNSLVWFVVALFLILQVGCTNA